ncbi:MAG: hypothetical protein GVY28_05410 [Alphaproteobacteria bacterium]|nr:hypothetical protein [Alphaproteobacteria bacterium]
MSWPIGGERRSWARYVLSAWLLVPWTVAVAVDGARAVWTAPIFDAEPMCLEDDGGPRHGQVRSAGIDNNRLFDRRLALELMPHGPVKLWERPGDKDLAIALDLVLDVETRLQATADTTTRLAGRGYVPGAVDWQVLRTLTREEAPLGCTVVEAVAAPNEPPRAYVRLR